MSARWKRNTVVATMVLLVCAAVALNWKYTGEQAADAVEETGMGGYEYKLIKNRLAAVKTPGIEDLTTDAMQ